MKDLEPILNVLSNYHSGFVLSEDELGLLSEWLKESEAHEDLFDDLSKGFKWILGSFEGNIRGKIKARLIEMEET